MKKFGIFSLFLLGWAFLTQAQDATVLQGTITNPAGETVALIYEDQAFLGERMISQGKVEADGRFRVEMKLKAPALCVFSHGREQTSVYLYPAEKTELNLDTKQFDESLTYQGDNRSAPASNFLAAYFLEFEDMAAIQAERKAIKEGTPADYVAHQAEQAAAFEAFLAARAKDLPADFVELAKDRFAFSQAAARLRYPSYAAYFKGLDSPDSLDLPKDFFAAATKLRLNRPERIDLPAYGEFLETYLVHEQEQYPAPEGMDETTAHFLGQYELARKLLTGPVSYMMQANSLQGAISYGNINEAGKAYEVFSADPEAQRYLEELGQGYEKALRLAPGQPAPAFTLKNEAGEEVSLSDFQGKVVYLDFWASWCGPCRAQAPFARKLQERFAGEEDLVFLYLSIDDDADAWKKAMEEEELKGVHLHSQGFGSSAPVAYGVEGIPSYFIIHRDGTIADPRAPRPSSEAIDGALQAALDRTGKAAPVDR